MLLLHILMSTIRIMLILIPEPQRLLDLWRRQLIRLVYFLHQRNILPSLNVLIYRTNAAIDLGLWMFQREADLLLLNFLTSGVWAFVRSLIATSLFLKIRPKCLLIEEIAHKVLPHRIERFEFLIKNAFQDPLINLFELILTWNRLESEVNLI